MMNFAPIHLLDCYDTIIFLQNIHNRHFLVLVQGCILWVESMIYVLLIIIAKSYATVECYYNTVQYIEG